MTRRLILSFLSLIVFASLAWPRFKEEDQKYLDEQFRSIQEQFRALTKQLQTLDARLTEARQAQSQLQETLTRQQQALQELQQVVSSIRTSGDENYSSLKATLAQLQADTQKAAASLAANTASSVAGNPAGRPNVAPVTQGYVTNVDRNEVVIDQGSGKGLRVGSRLAFFKATDPTTRVGELEVTVVTGAGSSRARILTMAAGVRPEFGDIVRLE